jgi:hypothetical protein
LRLALSWFAQPNTRPAAILVDELDAGGFKRAPDYLEGRVSRRACAGFQLMDRHDTDTCFTS